MPIVTLPDGSQRAFDQPVTVDEVAASIGPGLRKAALAGRVDGKLVDTSFVIAKDAQVAIVTDKDPDALSGHPPFHRASARAGGQGALPEPPR